MKKFIVYLLIMLFANGIVIAQISPEKTPTDNQKSFNIGLKAGLNLSNAILDEQTLISEKSPLLAFHAGIYANHFLSNKFALQGELLFSKQGHEVIISVANQSITSKSTMNYLSIPLLGKYYFSESINIHAGIAANLLLGAKVDDGTHVQDMENYESLELGGIIGLEYDHYSGLNLSLRYQHGLSPFLNQTFELETTKSYNYLIQLSLGYTLVK